MIKVDVHQFSGIRHPLNLGKHVEVKVCGATGGFGHLSPRVTENPADEIPRVPTIEWILRHATGEKAQIVEKVEELLAQWTV